MGILELKQGGPRRLWPPWASVISRSHSKIKIFSKLWPSSISFNPLISGLLKKLHSNIIRNFQSLSKLLAMLFAADKFDRDLCTTEQMA